MSASGAIWDISTHTISRYLNKGVTFSMEIGLTNNCYFITPLMHALGTNCDPLWKNRPLALKYDFAVGGSILDSTLFFRIFFLWIF